jgi:SAM-dependent methyltransferase
LYQFIFTFIALAKELEVTNDDNRETAAHYGPRADAYVSSAVHAHGPDLDQMARLLESIRPARALDLGCGGGHVSYRAAEYADEVIACDVTPAMVAAVAATAAERGIANIRGVVGAAEALPFADAYFDAVLCRFTAHHWADLPAGLAEARRIAKPGALLVFIDTVAPADRRCDTHLQAIEYLRDPSHARNYTIAELQNALAKAGFEIASVTPRPLRMDFPVWTQRTNTPPDKVAILRSLQREAGAKVRDEFNIAADGSFDIAAVTFVGAAGTAGQSVSQDCPKVTARRHEPSGRSEASALRSAARPGL